jgi:hypothetical protein
VFALFCLLGLSIAFFSHSQIFNWLFFGQSESIFYGGGSWSEEEIFAYSSQAAWLGSGYVFAGILLLFLAIYALPKKEKWAFKAMLIGIFYWYIINSGFNFYHGIYFKLIINTVFLLSVIIPLIIMAKDFKEIENK